ncbi:hypothetical protein Tco_0506549, partial [Tanacetum coccineum]
MEFHAVSYRIDNVARPILLFSPLKINFCGLGFFWIRHIDLVSSVVFGEVQARIRHIFLDGYGALDRLRCKGVTKQTFGVILKGLALLVFLE